MAPERRQGRNAEELQVFAAIQRQLSNPKIVSELIGLPKTDLGFTTEIIRLLPHISNVLCPKSGEKTRMVSKRKVLENRSIIGPVSCLNIGNEMAVIEPLAMAEMRGLKTV